MSALSQDRAEQAGRSRRRVIELDVEWPQLALLPALALALATAWFLFGRPPRPATPTMEEAASRPLAARELENDESIFSGTASGTGDGTRVGVVPVEPAGPTAPPHPAPAAPGASSRAAAPAAAGYYVQVFSGDALAAGKLQARLAGAGFKAAVSAGTGRTSRVRVGPYPSRDEALQASRRLKSEQQLAGWLVNDR